jgi:hypothetical protein
VDLQSGIADGIHTPEAHPVFKIPRATGIANAAARRAGTHGEVTRQAESAEWSRPTVSDPAQKVQAASEAEHAGGPRPTELIQPNQCLRQEKARPWDRLAQAIEFPASKQHELAVTARAMGLSLNQVLTLRALIRGAKARPGRSTIQRRFKAAGPKAACVLKHLDRRCRTLVLVGCLDEIFFHRRPILVGVEPTSMVWSLGPKAEDRQGTTWFKAWNQWPALQYLVADAGPGLRAGINRVQQQRPEGQQAPLEDGRDVFPRAQEARCVLRLRWSRVERLWERAEVATRPVAQAPQQGRDARGMAAAARSAGTTVEAAFARFERPEAGWRIAHAALQVFGPEGQLNERCGAAQPIASALPKLSGREWSKVCGSLRAQETLTSLDRRHRQWREAQPEEERLGARVRLGWLRRPRPRGSSSGPTAGSGPGAHLVQMVVCHKGDANWQESYRRGARVLRQTVRASGAVECLDSVLRMPQARHRTVSQGMRDRKRRSWDCRVFRAGKRRGRCPYRHLGVRLPSYDSWRVLHMARGEAA